MKKIKLEEDFGNIEEFKGAMGDKCLSVWNMFIEIHPYLTYGDHLTWQYIFEKFGITFDISIDNIAYNFEIKI